MAGSIPGLDIKSCDRFYSLLIGQGSHVTGCIHWLDREVM